MAGALIMARLSQPRAPHNVVMNYKQAIYKDIVLRKNLSNLDGIPEIYSQVMSYLRNGDWPRYVLRTRVFMARMYPHLYFVNGVCPNMSDERLSDLLANFTGLRFRFLDRPTPVRVVGAPVLEEKTDFTKISRPSVSANVQQTRRRIRVLRKDLPAHNAQKKELNRVRKQNKKRQTRNRAYDRDSKTELEEASYGEEPGCWDYPDYDEYDADLCYCCDRRWNKCRCDDYLDDYYDHYGWDPDDYYDDYYADYGYW